MTQRREDLQARIDIERSIFPDTTKNLADEEHFEKVRPKKYLFERFLYEIDGKPVAFAEYMEPFGSYRPGKYEFDIQVMPEFERRGIGSHFYDYMVAQLSTRDPAPNYWTAGARDDKPQSMRFLEKRGFQAVMRWPGTRLQLSKFDFEQFRGLIEKLEGDGVRFLTPIELESIEPEWKRKYYELDVTAGRDEPQPDAPTPPTYEEFCGWVFDNPAYIPEANYIAVDGGEFVGLSTLWLHANNPDRLETGFTAVLRSHRRRGIATALKAYALNYAKERGTVEIQTDNEENNPMLQINLKLGFEPIETWIAYERKENPVDVDGDGDGGSGSGSEKS